MSATIIDFDGRRIAPYMVQAIEGFINDPPDSDFQYGYLAAIINVWREGLGKDCQDARLIAAEALVKQRSMLSI